jgi:magnesium-transporting ATPase (P-type)
MALLEPTNLLLLACALVYALIGEPADGAVLLVFVLAIVVLDGLQRHRSDRALAELARLSAPRARVRRGDVDLDLGADEVRLGDRLRLEEGDRVAADARLLEGVGLWLDESLLTGESLPMPRQAPGELILAGSLVAAGRGWAAVTAVAEETQLGRLGRSLSTVEAPPTRLQRRSRRLTARLTLLAMAVCAGLMVLQGVISGDWPRALLAGLALALALLPNEIPVVLALFLALGALRLARLGVLARWPAAVESLGSATVLAVDKTGTLTDNRMAVQRLLCHLTPEAARGLQQAADQLAAEGLRVLAVARGLEGIPRHGGSEASGDPPADPHDFLFEPVGFLGLADPLRPDVPQAIATAQRAGVRVVMITGDGPDTARAIADQAGLPPGPVLCGADLPAPAGESSAAGTALSASALSASVAAASVAAVSVFARVLPQQKLELVRALQAGGAVVAMTGDGVNDATALKAADIGVAMGRRGTAVARESADLVLLNDRFTDLVAALALGRRVDANLQRALAYTLAIHLPIALLALLPLLLPGVALILLPVHIALLHLVIDPACTVVFEAMRGEPDLMDRPPRPPESPLLSAASRRRALLQGGALALASLALVFWPGCDGETRRSLVFSLLLLAGGGLVGLAGGPRHPLTAAGPAMGLGLWLLLFLVQPLRQALALAPLPPGLLLVLVVVTAVTLAVASLARDAPGMARDAAALRGTG